MKNCWSLFLRLDSPGPLTDDSSVNFMTSFFFIFCWILAENEEKTCHEIYGWFIRNFSVVCKWNSRGIQPVFCKIKKILFQMPFQKLMSFLGWNTTLKKIREMLLFSSPQLQMRFTSVGSRIPSCVMLASKLEISQWMNKRGLLC